MAVEKQPRATHQINTSTTQRNDLVHQATLAHDKPLCYTQSYRCGLGHLAEAGGCWLCVWCFHFSAGGAVNRLRTYRTGGATCLLPGLSPNTTAGKQCYGGCYQLPGVFTMPVGHRPGSLRQVNKKHKGNAGHQSKRAAKSALGAGRVVGGPKAGVKKAGGQAEAGKQQRANHTVQMRKKKREEIWLQKRLGSDAGPPKLCVWVSLAASATPSAIQQGVLNECARSSGEPSTGVGMVSAAFNQFKQRVTFVTPGRDLSAVLEFAKVADLLLVVLPVQEGADSAVDEVRASSLLVCGEVFSEDFADFVHCHVTERLCCVLSIGCSA